ncbi:MAG: glutathione peroxidase [Halobacteriovoraceae bacterium]|nr:glutathione peroxidase [Halobacteriovoraceae bacterium]|tara:strand:+ start:1045 stop:1593 length:549 start_codon:yes stop_codon:yes gene_type:complete
MSTIKEIPFKNAQGESKTLKDFPAKAYLIVNTASKCGLTPQYEALQALYKEYKEQGLEILGFPANEFLEQEPGSTDEIQSFCKLNFGVEFPILQKIVVKGENQHPLYQALTEGREEAVRNESGDFEKLLTDKGLITGDKKDIHWNFEKFLLDENGNIVERFFPDVSPQDDKIVGKVQELVKS